MTGIWNTWNNSGLGDYVHLRSWRYQVYGINRNFGHGQSFQSSITEAYKEARSIAQKTAVKSGTAQEVENFYNAILKQEWNDKAFTHYSAFSGKDIETLEQVLTQAMMESMNKNLLEIDRKDLGVKANKTNYFGSLSYSGLKDKGRISIKQQTLTNIVSQALNIIQIVGSQIANNSRGLSEKSLSNLKKNFEEFKHLYTRLYNFWSANDENFIPFRSSYDEYNSLGELIREIVYCSKRLVIPTQAEAGAVGEVFGAYAALMANNKIDTITKQMIKDSVIGGKEAGSQNLVELSSFIDKGQVLEELNKQVVGGQKAQWTLEGGALVSGSTSQDTVDVAISFSDSNNVFGVQNLMASIKNYFDPTNITGHSHKVSVISDTSLLFILNLLNSNFSNHYLNLLVGSGSSNNFNIATEVLKYGVAVRGLSGARTANFNKLSQYFIVNSQTQKHIYVFSTAELLDRLSPYPGLFDDSLAQVTGLPGFGALASTNYFHTTVQQRLAHIIADVHKFKLSMSLEPAVFVK